MAIVKYSELDIGTLAFYQNENIADNDELLMDKAVNGRPSLTYQNSGNKIKMLDIVTLVGIINTKFLSQYNDKSKKPGTGIDAASMVNMTSNFTHKT